MTGLFIVKCIFLLATSFPDGPIGNLEFPLCKRSGEVSVIDSGRMFSLPTLYTVSSKGVSFELLSGESL